MKILIASNGLIMDRLKKIKAFLEKNNCNLLDICQQPQKMAKIVYICSNGHESTISWTGILERHKRLNCLCLDCVHGVAKKEVTDEIKQKINANINIVLPTHLKPVVNNYDLHNLDEKNIDLKTKIQIRKIKEAFEKMKYTVKRIEQTICPIKNPIMAKNRNKYKIDYICSNGHNGIMRWGDWTSGKRCPECESKKRQQKKLKNIANKKCVTTIIRYE